MAIAIVVASNDFIDDVGTFFGRSAVAERFLRETLERARRCDEDALVPELNVWKLVLVSSESIGEIVFCSSTGYKVG